MTSQAGESTRHIRSPAFGSAGVFVVGSMAWAATIAPQVHQLNLDLHVLGSLAEAARLPSRHAKRLFVVKLNDWDVVATIRWMDAERPIVPAAVVVCVGWYAVRHQWALREAGAAAIFARTWQTSGLSHVLRRFAAVLPIEPQAQLLETKQFLSQGSSRLGTTPATRS